MNQNWGKGMIVFGGVIVLAGILVYFFHDKLNWLGRLPGDIHIERENVRFYFPVTTMILISLLLMMVVNIVRRFL